MYRACLAFCLILAVAGAGAHVFQWNAGRDEITVADEVEQELGLEPGALNVAVDDFLHPDRVVVGCDDPDAARRVGALYDAVHPQLIITDPASAELIKYAANAFLATKLSFVNAIATICEQVGADIDDVVVGVGYDSRIGSSVNSAG